MHNILSLDIETTGLDPYRDEITCVGIYGRDGNVSRVYRDLDQLDYDLRTKYNGWGLVGHNFKFDIHFLVNNGFDLSFLLGRWEHDTQFMSHVLTDKVSEQYLEWYETKRVELNKELPVGYSHRKTRGSSLKVLAPYWLDVPPFWEDPTSHDDDEYVLKDCKYTWDLCKMFKTKLNAKGQYSFYKDRMMNWGKMLMEAEKRGIMINDEKLIESIYEHSTKAEQLKRELDEEWAGPNVLYKHAQTVLIHQKYSEMSNQALLKAKANNVDKTIARYNTLRDKAVAKIEDLNYDSPKQMLWLLKDHFGLPVKTVEGKESTGKAVLESIANKGRKDVGKFLEWRKANKILTAFLPTYQKLQYKGVVHPTFNLTGTRTGRLSSSGPNMQQVPPSLYKIFKPRDGYKYIQYDLASIEAALIAYYSGDPMLFDVIQSGQSIHNANARVFFNLDCDIKDVKDKYPEERYASKHVGFALFYGAGTNRIKHTFANFGFMIDKGQAYQMHQNFKEYYKQAAQFHKDITNDFAQGNVKMNVMGRPIKIQDPEDAYMKGFNTLVQSSASDLNIRAGELAREQWIKEGLDCQILLFIHDCIVAEVKEEHAVRADQILKESMTGFNLTNSLGKIILAVEGGIKTAWEKD